MFFLDCWQEKFADVGSLQKAILVKIEVFWPSVDRKDISEYFGLQRTGFEFWVKLDHTASLTWPW